MLKGKFSLFVSVVCFLLSMIMISCDMDALLSPKIDLVSKDYYKLSEYANGNGDNLITPGESLYLDIKFKHNGTDNLSKVKAKLSTTCSYVTIVRDTRIFETMSAQYYYSLTDYSSSESSCQCLYGGYAESYAFKIYVSSSCPVNTQIPFKVTFTDSSGHSTTVSFNVTVYSGQASLVLNDYSLLEFDMGNGDNYVTPGESLYLDVKIQNVGNSNAMGATAKLSTTCEYVEIIRDSYTIGDMKKGNYYSLTDYSSSESSCYLMYSNKYETNAFKFSVSLDCPVGINIPFVITCTDNKGNKSSLNLSIRVYKCLAQCNISKYSTKEYQNGNGDGHVTPGESLYLDVKVQNSGTSDAIGVTAKVSTTCKYVQIIRDTYTIGNMKKGYYYSLTDSSSSESSCYLMYSNKYETNAFKFSVSLACPEGTNIPFIITFEDYAGNTWERTLQIPVAKVSGTLDNKLWGTWIKMDTGTEYYIDTVAVYESYSSNKKYSKSNYSVDDFVFDGDNVIRSGSSVFFRKGGSSRAFTMQVAGFSDSESSRAMSSAKAGVVARRENKNNVADVESVVSSSEGTISFANAVADDVQVVFVSSGTMNSSVSVAPAFDGQNVGTIPLVEPDMYGFKITYSINGDEQGFCYGNSYKSYNLNLQINNIGSEICKTSMYEISCDDPNFNIVSGGLTGNFTSVEPGKSKTVSLSVKYGNLTQEYIDVPISISITDSKYLRTWNDSVTIRFYKGVVSLKVNSRNFENTGATLKGFLIYPDGRSKRFTVSAGSTQTVLVPWSESDYVLVFSGATTTSELAYSFAFTGESSVADLSGTWSIDAINGYENNDSYASAYNVTSLSSPVKAYLNYEDIDFYKVNVSNVSLVSN